MRTKLVWPATGREIGGLMGFSSEWINYEAGDYLQGVKPMVENIIVGLETTIDELKSKNAALKTALAANKPKVKYDHETGNWLVVKGTRNESS